MNKKTKEKKLTYKDQLLRFWKSNIKPLIRGKIGVHLIIVLLLSYAFITGTETLKWFWESDKYDFEVGDIPQEDIILQQDLRYLDQEATDKKRALRLATVHPVFVMRENVTLQVLNRFDEFRYRMQLFAESDNPLEIPEDLVQLFPLEMIEALSSLDNLEHALDLTRQTIVTIMYRGYFSLPEEEDQIWEGNNLIEIITSGETQGIKATVSLEDILTLYTVQLYIDQILAMEYLPDERELIRGMILYFIQENCYYNQVLSVKQQREVSTLVDPVFITLPKGDILIYGGSALTTQDIEKLEALRTLSDPLTTETFLYPLFYLGLILFLGTCFLVYMGRKVKKPNIMILALYLMLLFILLLHSLFLFSSLGRVTLFLVLLPAGFLTLLMSQLMDRKEDLLVFSVLLSLAAFFLSDGGELYLIYTLISSLAGLLVLSRGERRLDLLKAGARLGLVHFVTICAIYIYQGNSGGNMLFDLMLALLSGPAASLMVMFLLPLMEQWMNSCTAFRLTELSNLNDPIMKRMFLRAPGTYVHSINVAYMAEPACESIGANALLARVGGYYHDIGKIDQSEYYIENQKEGNKHDELKASLSAAIIKSHVKAGVEKARELHLPTEIIDIIAQHHGTSLIRYFYDRAMKDDKAKTTVNIEDFCHPGPRPQSKEGAVVMLADTVEAATRTLRKPTRAKLEKYIWELIIDRFQTGELNDSGLTLKELEIIKENFVHVLTGHFHSRVEYPVNEEKKNGK